MWKGEKKSERLHPDAANAYEQTAGWPQGSIKTRGDIIHAAAYIFGRSQVGSGTMPLKLNVPRASLVGPKIGKINSTQVRAKINTQQRANEIQNAQTNQVARNKSTTAVSVVETESGETKVLVSSSRKKLTPEQRAALLENEIPIEGEGHAEATIINHAKQNNYIVKELSASRRVCENCAGTIFEYQPDAVVPTPLKPVKALPKE